MSDTQIWTLIIIAAAVLVVLPLIFGFIWWRVMKRMTR